MRITREALMKVVRETVSQRVRTDRSIVSIYLCGSLLGEEYLLGGAADIDLVLIHADEIGEKREIVGLTDAVHLDIAHHAYKDYRQTRRLRVDPWMGPTLKACQILHDPQHFMDFTQASVRGQFDDPQHVYDRALQGLEKSRSLWRTYSLGGELGLQAFGDYLEALEWAMNCIAVLTGAPLPPRRLLLDFPKRAEAVKRPGLTAGVMGLLGAGELSAGMLNDWLEPWKKAYDQAVVPALHPARWLYYRGAVEVLLKEGKPAAALWPLLRTWTLALQTTESRPGLDSWLGALAQLGFTQEGFESRLDGLDAYLDTVEERLDAWAHETGATPA